MRKASHGMQSAPDRLHMASEERRRLHSPRLPGQLMTHSPTGSYLRWLASLASRGKKLGNHRRSLKIHGFFSSFFDDFP